jgi:hypothetical protein
MIIRNAVNQVFRVFCLRISGAFPYDSAT